ncbi:helix-turn-helix transcriptional regulator [Streptomyces sp. NPDC048629]|uniref:helix-turn-helix transcriptional regulator n=1 Tax=Streptomyces sp. NPDC048629 TaxID=3154824 RepID=UPI003420936C
MNAGERAPDPQGARTPAEFLARLQELKDWSGLTYRELSARAEAVGDVLPRSTVANMLTRAGLPREELLAAFVRACGTPPGERETWVVVRKELATGGVRTVPGSMAAAAADRTAEGAAGTTAEPAVSRSGAGPMPDLDADVPAGAAAAPAARWAPGGSAHRGRIPRVLVAVVAVAGLGLAVSSVVALVRDGVERVSGPPVTPAAGPVLIRTLDAGLCLGEKPSDRSGQVYQRECAGADVPRYELMPLTGRDSGHWRLVTHHPEFGVGCTGVPGAAAKAAAPLHDSECGEQGRTESFRLEPFGTPVEGYRIRPGDSAQCITVTGDPRAPWARLETAACADDARGRRGQLFSFDRRD